MIAVSSDTEYRFTRRRRQTRDTDPTPVTGSPRRMTEEQHAAMAAAHLQAALDEVGWSEPYQGEHVVRVELTLTPAEAHALASVLVAEIVKRK